MGIKLVVGLGNPGKAYVGTRHNIGYRVIDILESEKWDRMDLFKPSGFMNTSGGPVQEQARRNGFAPHEVLVICDDFTLPIGSLRLRVGGSSGGHNGLDSILQAFGTQSIPRLRVGIGPVPPQEDPADFVLKTFRGEEKVLIDEMVGRAAEAVKVIADKGWDTAMNQFNKRAA